MGVHPNKQNERYWAEVDPEVEVDCRITKERRKINLKQLKIFHKIKMHWIT